MKLLKELKYPTIQFEILIFHSLKGVVLIPHLFLLRIFEHGQKYIKEEEAKIRELKEKKIPGNQSSSLDLKLCFLFKIIIYKSWLTGCLCCFYATYKQSCSHIYFSGLTDTFVVCSLATETGKNLPARTKSPKCSEHPTTATSLKVQDAASPPPQGIKGQSRAPCSNHPPLPLHKRCQDRNSFLELQGKIPLLPAFIPSLLLCSNFTDYLNCFCFSASSGAGR